MNYIKLPGLCLGQAVKCYSHMAFRNTTLVTWSRFRRRNDLSSAYSTEALTKPTPSSEQKEYDEKLKAIVSQISKLTLIEVAELNELLKRTLNIPDAPLMMSMPMGGATAPAEEEEEDAPKTKTSFTVKLLKYDEAKKVPLIKEMKNIIEGMNLVQAKKFIESVPQVVRADIGKDEAEKIKAAIQAVGGECEIE